MWKISNTSNSENKEDDPVVKVLRAVTHSFISVIRKNFQVKGLEKSLKYGMPIKGAYTHNPNIEVNFYPYGNLNSYLKRFDLLTVVKTIKSRMVISDSRSEYSISYVIQKNKQDSTQSARAFFTMRAKPRNKKNIIIYGAPGEKTAFTIANEIYQDLNTTLESRLEPHEMLQLCFNFSKD